MAVRVRNPGNYSYGHSNEHNYRHSYGPVSYTHLDVYKRQLQKCHQNLHTVKKQVVEV